MHIVNGIESSEFEWHVIQSAWLRLGRLGCSCDNRPILCSEMRTLINKYSNSVGNENRHKMKCYLFLLKLFISLFNECVSGSCGSVSILWRKNNRCKMGIFSSHCEFHNVKWKGKSKRKLTWNWNNITSRKSSQSPNIWIFQWEKAKNTASNRWLCTFFEIHWNFQFVTSSNYIASPKCGRIDRTAGRNGNVLELITTKGQWICMSSLSK